MKVDLLIIGGGPAGLSAALFFSRLKRSTLVYDSGVYRNAGVQVAHTIFGHEGVNPAEYRAKARKEIQDGYPWTTFRDTKVTSLVPDGKGFKAQDAQGQEVLARKVILATGIKDNLAPIPGESRDSIQGAPQRGTRTRANPKEDVYKSLRLGIQEAWGKRLIHCIFCHGTETANQEFGFLLGIGTNASFNPMMVKGIFTMWHSLQHTKTYILTNGHPCVLPLCSTDAQGQVRSCHFPHHGLTQYGQPHPGVVH